MRPLPLDHAPSLGAPLRPSASWFERPSEAIPEDRYINVLETGEVFGRFRSNGVPLLTDTAELEVPQPSPTGYKLFHRSSALTAEGDTLEAGVVTLSGHGASNYDDVRNVVATVRCGDDEYGGWFAGALVPEATVADGAQLRRSQLSGEWVLMSDAWFNSHGVEPDKIGNGLELSGLTVCTTGRAVLHKTYKGWPATVHGLSADELEARLAAYENEVRRVLDEHPPAVAVDVLRRVLDVRADRERFHRVARAKALPVPRLPQERVPQPIRLSIQRRTS